MLIADTALSMVTRIHTETRTATVSVEDTIRLTGSTLVIVAGSGQQSQTAQRRRESKVFFNF